MSECIQIAGGRVYNLLLEEIDVTYNSFIIFYPQKKRNLFFLWTLSIDSDNIVKLSDLKQNCLLLARSNYIWGESRVIIDNLQN